MRFCARYWVGQRGKRLRQLIEGEKYQEIRSTDRARYAVLYTMFVVNCVVAYVCCKLRGRLLLKVRWGFQRDDWVKLLSFCDW